MKSLPIMAIDASSYAFRVVVTEKGHNLLDFLEGQPYHAHSLITFVHDWQKRCPGTPLVASPIDHWPEGLEKQLRKGDITITWLSPEMMRCVARTLVPWNKKRRLHRAGLLACLANSNPTGDAIRARTATLNWEAYMAREIVDQVNSELLSDGDFA